MGREKIIDGKNNGKRKIIDGMNSGKKVDNNWNRQ